MNAILNRPRTVSLSVTPNQQAQAVTGRPHLSYSEVRSYQSCPLKWHFQYVEKAVPEQLSAAMLLGSCVHAVIQRVLESKLASDPVPTVDELMVTYRQTWVEEAKKIPIQFAKGQDEQTLEQLARRMIETFLSSTLSMPPGRIIGIEEDFKVKLAVDLPDLAGRVDMITHDAGDLLITDFKTARSIPTEDAADDMAEQLILYSAGCRNIADQLKARIRLRYVFLTKTKEPKVEAIEVTLDESRRGRTTHLVRSVFRAMQTGIVYPAPSPINCPSCAFRHRCMTWQDRSHTEGEIAS